jgi:hypothetical protein
MQTVHACVRNRSYHTKLSGVVWTYHGVKRALFTPLMAPIPNFPYASCYARRMGYLKYITTQFWNPAVSLHFVLNYLKVVYKVTNVADAFVFYHQLTSKICHFYMRHLTPCRVVNITFTFPVTKCKHRNPKATICPSTQLNIPKYFILRRSIHARHYHCWS